MKRCGRCQYENADAMSFCLQCGTPLAGVAEPAAPDTIFNQSAETLIGASPHSPANFANAPNVPNVPNAGASRGKKIFLIVGGVLALFGLLLGAAALIVFFNWKSKRPVIVNSAPPRPQPTRGIANRGSSGSLSGDPSGAPSPAPTATPQVSFTPPVEATKKGTFTVYANSGWQLSEIETVENESFRTSAAGLVDLAGIKTGVTTRGVTDAASKARRIYAEYPTGALMMRTRYADGRYSNVQPVTAGASGTWQNFPDERGRLEFCINDNAPQQNGGQFTVTKTSVRVPKPKK